MLIMQKHHFSVRTSQGKESMRTSKHSECFPIDPIVIAFHVLVFTGIAKLPKVQGFRGQSSHNENSDTFRGFFMNTFQYRLY